MIRRRFSLPRLLGLGDDTPARHARREPAEDFLDPYRTAEVAGERFRRQYADTPLFGESVAATGTEPHNSQAGLQAWKGAVR